MGAIMELNEFIDSLNDFIDNVSERKYYIGGIVGTNVFKITIDCVLAKTNFENICVIEGCQDYIGLSKPSICRNHLYYMDLIKETKIPNYGSGDSFDRGYMVWNPLTLEYKYEIDTNCFIGFDYIIINDSQLIPPDILNAIENTFPGKIIVIFDPYEYGAESYIGYSNIVDTLSKQSTIVAFARSIFNVPTRSIDKSVKCSVKESKISRRSIGSNNSQYVTNNKFIASALWEKQINSSFKRGQKLWVMDDRIFHIIDSNNVKYSITKNSLLVVDSVPTNRKSLRLRVWNSKCTFNHSVAYKKCDDIDKIFVVPANMLMIDQMRYHRFSDTVLISDNVLNQRERYLIVKNTNNLTIGI